VSSRHASCVLDPDPVAARQARAFVTTTCHEWQRDKDVDTVALLTSELVTNGVLHARTQLAVRLEDEPEGLRVEVHDEDPRPPTPRGHRVNLLADIDDVLERLGDALTNIRTLDERHATLAVGPAGAIGAGRGLLLVEALSDEWGVELSAQGKAVWFRLAG
jgi:anti-sigma regulatory factor (Ser/Thr protein kinase)